MSFFKGLLFLRFLILIRTSGRCLLSILTNFFYLFRRVRGFLYQVLLFCWMDGSLQALQGFRPTLRRGRSGALGSSKGAAYQRVITYRFSGRLIMSSATTTNYAGLQRYSLGGDSNVVTRTTRRYQVGSRYRLYVLYHVSYHYSLYRAIYRFLVRRVARLILRRYRAFHGVLTIFWWLGRLWMFIGQLFYVTLFLRFYHRAFRASLIRLVRNSRGTIMVLLFGSTMYYRYLWGPTLVSTSLGVLGSRSTSNDNYHNSRLGLYGVAQLAWGVGVTLNGLAMASALQAINSPRTSGLRYLGQYQRVVNVIYVRAKGQGNRVMARARVSRVHLFLYNLRVWLLPALWCFGSRFLILTTLLIKGIYGVFRT